MKIFFSLLAFIGLTLAVHAQEAVFIKHPGVPDSALTAEDVHHILLGNLTKWRSGTVIRLIVQSGGEMHEQMIKTHTQRTPDQFEKHWKKLVFTGNGIMPMQAKTDAEVVAYVAATPGAFGYVARESVTEAVKVIAVQ